MLALLAGTSLAPLAVGSAEAAIEFKGPIQWHDWDAGLNAGIRSCAVRSGAPFTAEAETQAAARGVRFQRDFPTFVRVELGL